jgi:ribonuclease Y
MDDEDDPFTEAEVTDSPDVEELERMRRELDQRERGLSDLADELDDREAELNERAKELRQERKQLDNRKAELGSRENRIAEREAELDDRETAIQERERELSERAAELDETEATLQEYVNDAVRDTVREAVAETAANDGPGRFGRIGSLVLALVGVMLVVGGVLNGFAGDIGRVPVVFASDTANLAVTVLLLFSGLATNVAAVAD